MPSNRTNISDTPTPALTRADGVFGRGNVASARPFTHPHLYAPRLVPGPAGAWSLLGFLDHVDGEFVGELTDPIPLRYRASTGLTVDPARNAADWRPRS
ncbi:hypothetical protein [Micromonospora sp. NPDC000668]|uniref:hypothetical protein n=1 Tax=Micromonospora sp. NPDC000668 TaxID=3364219 RepID=UPI0036AA75BC